MKDMMKSIATNLGDEEISDGRKNWTEEEWRNYNEFVADTIAKEEEEVIEDMIEADNDY